MDGLFELIVIGLILLAPVLEGVFKRRRREGRGPDGEPSAAGGPPERAGAGAGDREATGSEDLLPADLWEELTGGPPPWRADQERPGATSAPTRDAPAGGEGHTLEVEADELEPWRSPAEKEPGDEGVWISVPPDEIGADEIGSGPGAHEDAEALRREALRQELSLGAGGAAGRGSRGRRTRVPGSGVTREGEGRHPLLGEVDATALRRAVVWREILGKPRALRRRGDRD